MKGDYYEKIILDKNELVDYMKNDWRLYTSECINKELHRLWFNCEGDIKITVNNKITIITKDIDRVIEFFNEF